LQVLRQRMRGAEPRDVADVGEDGRAAAHLHRDLLAEEILVADVEGDALAGDRQWRLVGRAAREVAERNVHQVDEPAEAEGNELAERNEMPLVVAPDDRSRAVDDADAVGERRGGGP